MTYNTRLLPGIQHSNLIFLYITKWSPVLIFDSSMILTFPDIQVEEGEARGWTFAE